LKVKTILELTDFIGDHFLGCIIPQASQSAPTLNFLLAKHAGDYWPSYLMMLSFHLL